MGNSKSKPVAAPPGDAGSAPNTATTAVAPTPKKRSLKVLPDDVTARVGIIGAGLPGLFAARELALAGFDVTVLDASPTILTGSATHCIGAYGTGVPHTSPWSIAVAKEYLRGFLPRSDSVFLSTETPPLRLVDSVVWNWLYHRTFGRVMPEADRSSLMAGLKRRSTEVMNRIHEEHPELRKHIIDERLIDGAASGAAPFTQTIIDVPKWSSNFAKILHEEYDVKFVLDRQVTFLQLKLAFDTESVHHVHARNLEEPQNPVVEAHPFDIFVFAAGKKMTRVLWPNYTAPVLELGGCAIDVPLDSTLAQKLNGPYGISESAHGIIRWGYVRNAMNETRLRVSGLWNPSLRNSSMTPEWVAYALARKGHLTGDAVDKAQSLLPSDLSKVQTMRFSRGFTPDGLPIASKFGSCFNAFVLGGFGDDVVPTAAGAADVLGRLVMKELSEEDNPLSLTRFGAAPVIAPDDHKPTWQERLGGWETRTAYKSLESFIPSFSTVTNVIFPKKDAPLQETFVDELPFQRRMRLKAEKKRAAEQHEQHHHAGDNATSSPS